MIKGAARLEGRAPMSGFEALRPWRCRPIAAALQAAAQQLAQLWYRGRGGGVSAPARALLAKRMAPMAGVCTVAILLLAVPLFTLEADARGGFGGHGGGFGGHGGFAGRGGGGFGGARSFGVGRFGGAGRWSSLLRRGPLRWIGRSGSLLQRGARRRAAHWRPCVRRPQFRRALIGVAARRDGAVHRRPLYRRLGPHARRDTRRPLGRPRRGRQPRHCPRRVACAVP